MLPRVFFVTLFLCCLTCYAQVNLYIPNTDPEALSANNIGVDSNGRTSWVISPATPTGDEPAPDPDTPAYTIVEGPNDVIIPTQTALLVQDSGVTITEILYNSCAIGPDGQSTCHFSLNKLGPGDGQAQGTVGVFTEPAETFELQGGGGAVTPVAPAPSAPVQNTFTPSPTPTPTPAPTPQGNGPPVVGTSLPTSLTGSAPSIHPIFTLTFGAFVALFVLL